MWRCSPAAVGSPTCTVAGLASDPQWGTWSRARVNVAIRATAPDRFEVVPLTPAEYGQWRALQETHTPELIAVDGSREPWTIDPEALALGDVLAERPVIGGKAAGFAVLGLADVPRPEQALAITVRAYQAQVDHMELLPTLLDHDAFGPRGDPRARWLILEGQEGYGARYGSAGDAAFAKRLIAETSPVTAHGAWMRNGGVRAAFEQATLVPWVRDGLAGPIATEFASFAPTQGLRFRSSSNVEDVEGFVGAGLYRSASGTREAFEQALLDVWGSYWSFEAFEERHAVGIDHAAGAMGVLVHARFQDELELANGVITATWMPDGGVELVVNAQDGALSVTNPSDRCAVPEVVVVWSDDAGSVSIERRQASSEVPGDVLTDTELIELAEAARAVLAQWIELENAAVPPERARWVQSLDFEFRRVHATWPLRADSQESGTRWVLKQARSLEPTTAHFPREIREAPFPTHLLARARWVEEVRCDTRSHSLTALQVRTDPALGPDLGFTERPFVGSVVIDDVQLTHLDWRTVDAGGEPWEIALTTVGDAPWVAVSVLDGALTLDDGDTPIIEDLVGSCTISPQWAAPGTFLDALLDAD